MQSNIGKIVCVGRNYADHAKELGNQIPTKPILFMKPASCVRHVSENIDLPKNLGACHYECELVVQLAKDLKNASLTEAKQAIGSMTLGLDLTLRDLQQQLKQQGHPWERAKSFDGACVLADWLDSKQFNDFNQIHYRLWINDELRQDGNSGLMLFAIDELLVEISHTFGLQAGDVIMTGTPAGVGKLQQGDCLRLQLANYQWTTKVISC